MRIELLTSPGCPNAGAAKEMVADCLSALGIDVAIIDRVGHFPSPTVLIDGVDVMRLRSPGANQGCVPPRPTHTATRSGRIARPRI